MATSPLLGSCPLDADDQFGPRVNAICRAFDFTLQFEDGFFIALPAAVFLLFVLPRLLVLWKTPTKMASRRLLACKLVLLSFLFGLHLLFLLLGPRTKLSLAAACLSTAAILAAIVLSFIEDRRSVRPSDLLVLYFSASTILSIPRLRSLWLITLPSAAAGRVIWTIIFIVTVVAVFFESLGKTMFLRPAFQHNVTKEQAAGFWSRSFFVWLLPFFQIGYFQILSLGDVPKIDNDLAEEAAWTRLNACWLRTAGRHRLIRAAFAANVLPFCSAVLPRLALSAFVLCQPFLIGTAVSSLATPAQKGQEEYGHALVGAFVFTYLGIAVSRAIYWRQTNRMITRIRSGLIAMVYRHTTALRAVDVQDSAAITLMGTDVERIVQALRFIHEVWASIPEIAVAIWLLARQMSYAAFMPLVVALASVAGASFVGARSGPAQKAWNERVEKRIAVTTKMISSMKVVKMLGWSDVLGDIVRGLREVEIRTSERFRYLRIWQILFGNAPTTLAPLATFGVYAIIATVKGDESLLSAQAFTSLALISLVTSPLITFCQALPSCIQAAACFSRIESYCSRQALSPRMEPSGAATESSIPLRERPSTRFASGRPGDVVASFLSADISWLADATEPVLRNLNLNVKSGFTAIVGPVGSGKSTLLETLIGETIITRGRVESNISKVAFCSQLPWITDDTIRHIIVGTANPEFDPKWYEFSVASCGLQQDLAGLPAGDQTVAGSNGLALSGGQRQRVALARAVYARLPVIILDDVTSGLDPTMVNFILTQLFGPQGHFRKSGTSVILATHNRSVLPYMDEIIVMDNGVVVNSGSYSEIRLTMPELAGSEDVTDESSNRDSAGQDGIQNKSTASAPTVTQQTPAANPQELDLQRRQGSWSVYAYYCRSAGTMLTVFWVVFTLAGAVSSNYMTIWIERWSDANSTAPNQQLGLYLGIYAMLSGIATLCTAGECWIFIISIITKTALHLHLELLHAVLAAPFAFFQSTDTGSIANRFSQDMDLIDMTLPSNAIQFTSAASYCLAQLVILCVLGKYLAAVVPILAAVLFVVQKIYLRSSRQLRLLDIEAKAPLYQIFIETIRGIPTIRSFHCQNLFHSKHQAILNDAQKPFYMLMCIQQWLALVLDLIVGAIAVTIVVIATSLSNSISAGAIGVGLVLILQFNEMLTQTLQSWTRLETSIGAVARVQKFVAETPSEPTGTAVLPAGWPARGAISFGKVVAGYPSNDKLILSDINLHVAPGEKLVVCGASGSGKTSLIMTLLRMTNLHQGAITIDDMDISQLAGSDVCAKINVVPQEAFFLPGTIRFNLDPQGRAADNAIEAAIRRVGLWGRIERAGAGLGMELVASEWSQGEMQLLCLARALLVPSKILILDEATSSVDSKTEAIMQEVIDSEWRQHTVISVLHRFAHINRFDRVAVLRSGQLVECDTPQALLSRQSEFLELYRAYNSGF